MNNYLGAYTTSQYNTPRTSYKASIYRRIIIRGRHCTTLGCYCEIYCFGDGLHPLSHDLVPVHDIKAVDTWIRWDGSEKPKREVYFFFCYHDTVEKNYNTEKNTTQRNN